jgi:hypothetical protein
MKKDQNGFAGLPVAKEFKFFLGQLVNLRISDEFGKCWRVLSISMAKISTLFTI